MTATAMKRRTVLIKTTIFDDELDDLCPVEVEALVMPNDDPMDYYNYRESEPFVEFCAIQGERNQDLIPNEDDSERLRNEILERYYELHQIEKEELEDALNIARDMQLERCRA
jgi:membrane peptidoglycan carboxypeptidase